MTQASVFLALKKVGVRQYEDSDSNLVLESARRRKAAKGNRNSRGVRGLAHPGIFCFREIFRCLLMICKGTFQALKKLIFY